MTVSKDNLPIIGTTSQHALLQGRPLYMEYFSSMT